MDNKRMQYVDLLRGFAAFLVILGHSFIVYPIDLLQYQQCVIIKDLIYAFHMPLFFFISGCVYSCTNYKEYVKKKAKRLIVPYLAFSVFDIIFRIIGRSLVNVSFSLKEGVINLLTLQINWFLPCLFMISLIYPILVKIFKNIFVILGFSLILVALVYFVSLTGLFQLYNVCYYFVFFVMGVVLKEIVLKHMMDFKSGVLSLLIVLSSLLAVTIFVFGEFIIPLPYTRHLQAVLFISTFCSIALLIQLKTQNKYCKALNPIYCLSRYSLQLYLFNGYLLVLFRVILVNAFRVNNPVLIVVSLTVLIIATSVLLCKFIEQIPLASFLCGLSLNRIKENKNE